jgi:DNA-binding transcriptional regulator/RsmH inhibitor MraZ
MEPRLQSRKEVQIQGKGRLTVPKEHRDYAELKEKEILLLGMLDHIRLSSVEKHKESEDKRRAQQMYWR